MDDKKDPPDELLKNLDLLMNLDLVQSEDKWAALKAMSHIKQTQPDKKEDKDNGD